MKFNVSKIPALILCAALSLEAFSDVPKLFIEEFKRDFSSEYSAEVGGCIATALYNSLSDQEKGLLQTALDFMQSDSLLDNEKAGNMMRQLYDQDKQISDEISRKWSEKLPGIELACRSKT